MAGGWDRRSALVRVDTATLERLLAPRWLGARVTSAEHVSGGLANTNYRVTLADRADPVVVRFYTREPQACAREAALLRLVAGRVPVPEALYVEPEAGRFTWPYIVLSWMDGTPLIDALPDLPRAEALGLATELGAVAARIGSFTFAEPGFLGPDLRIRERLVIEPNSLRSYLGEMLGGTAGERLGPTLTARLLAQIDANANALAPLAGSRSLIHADYKDGNILVRRESDGWHVTAVLDWEFAFVGASIFDLGSLLRREQSLPPGFAVACVAGYRAAGGFAPPGWRLMTLLMDLINLCDFLNSPHVRAGMVADLTALVRDTVERLEHGDTEYGD
ncbi:MAG TPA: aminoglycoside phosphotransferase family protein [Ktedonobacterales bacterium]|jgi:fructokinase|nr:aminoglycoside phosphotransferase family protein [Ktedonobacterales bacterium]